MPKVFRFLALGLALLGLAGCPNSCNPTEPSNNNGGGPAATATPTPVMVLSEAYPTGMGNWTFPNPNIQGSNNASTGHTANGCLEIVSSGYNATTDDHARNIFVCTATAVTTSFSIDYNILTNVSHTVEIRLELDNQTMWRLLIQGDGTFLFNDQAMTCTPYCPTALAWHRIVIKSSGTTTQSFTVDGYSVGSFTAVNANQVGDALGDMVHLKMSPALNAAGKVFRLDDLLITTP